MSEAVTQPGESRPAFTAGAVIALVLVGAFSFIALVVLGAYAPDQQGAKDPGAHALSKSAVGYAGMVELLRQMDRPALVARGPVTANTQPQIMVMTIDHGDPHTQLLNQPTTRNYHWPILEVLPKWATAPVLNHPGWVAKTGIRKVDAETWLGPSRPSPPARPAPAAGPKAQPDSDDEDDGDDAEDAAPNPAKSPPPTAPDAGKITLDHRPATARHTLRWVKSGAVLTTGPIEQLQVFSNFPNFEPVIVDEAGGVVLARVRRGNFYALSEPDLLNNQGIVDKDTARVGLAVLRTLTGGAAATTYFDVTLNGFGRSRSLIKLMVEPPFLAATLSVLFALGLIGWNAFNRFGAARRQGRVFALGKRVLADNQAGLYHMTRREPRLAGRYVQVERDLAARAVGAPRNLEGSALDAFLDRLATTRGAVDRLEALSSEGSGVRTTEALTSLAGRLHRWRTTVTGGR